MTDKTIEEEAELYLADVSRRLTGAREGECLFCYVARMLEEHEEADEWLPPEERPGCRGVRLGSTKSCGVWERRRRWGW